MVVTHEPSLASVCEIEDHEYDRDPVATVGEC